MIIDVHTHFLPATLSTALRGRREMPRIVESSEGAQIRYGDNSGHAILPGMEDVELRLRDMDAQGIGLAVLGTNVPGVDWFPARDAPVLAADINDELCALARAHPDRLAALATLPMQLPEAAAAELERAVGAGAVGAMIYSNVAGSPLDDPSLMAVFDAAAVLGVPLYVHPTYPLVAREVRAYALISTLGFLFDTSVAALRLVLGGLYERHPDFSLVLSHAGSLLPQLVGRIDYEAARMPNGMGQLSTPPSETLVRLYTDAVCAWPPALRSTLDFLGPDRVMFGSDYPFWDPQVSFDALEGAGFSDDVRERVERATAQRLFGLRPPPAAAP
jgi:aminocarboxymuconate-semialdehyde decarboxylase